VDLEILKKKLSTYRNARGQVRNVNDELLMEVLAAWEQWTGPAKGFYAVIGVSSKGMASIIGKAKKLRREGHFPIENFKEIKIEQVPRTFSGDDPTGLCKIELNWEGKQTIRFALVDQLIDFLKKSGADAA
jgi:hypothetical protein